MRKVKIYGFIFILLAGLRIAKAQQKDGWDILHKLLSTYSGQVSFKSDMKLYAADKPGKILEEINGRYLIDGRMRDYTIGYVEMIQTQKYYLMVNNDRKTIFISHVMDSLQGQGLFNLHALKQLLDSTGTEVKVYNNGKEKSLAIEMKDNSRVKSYRITYSSSKWMVRRMTVHLNRENEQDKGKVLDIRYYDYHINEEAEAITERKILTVKAEKIIPNKEYQGYKIISQL